MQQKEHEEHGTPDIFLKALEFPLAVHDHQVPDGAHEDRDREKEVCEDEKEEVFVVGEAQTLVDEWTVVVVALHAPAAHLAMERCFRLDYFAKHAQVIQVDLLREELIHQPHELKLRA
jgi:hypothetical protein